MFHDYVAQTNHNFDRTTEIVCRQMAEGDSDLVLPPSNAPCIFMVYTNPLEGVE